MKTLACPICHRDTVSLYHVKGYPGEYCQQCAPKRQPHWPGKYDENVNGTVFGTMTTRYEFWSIDNTCRLAVIDAEDDDKAIAWFREAHPQAFAVGARMRVLEP